MIDKLTLLKYALTDFHHAGVIEYKPVWTQRRKWTMQILKAVDFFLKKFGFRICKEYHTTKENRMIGNDWPLYADTMIGIKRLNNIDTLFFNAISQGVRGDFIETGVWRGGACIFARAFLDYYDIKDRKVWVCDSFEGLPKGSVKEDRGSTFHTRKELAASLDVVRENFRKYDLLDDRVVFLKGWFKDTLPTIPKDQKFAIIRLDGDMYESTMDALVHLYPKLSKGGYCVIDDYHLSGCKKAVDDYREKHWITDHIIQIDQFAVYWRKS